jgi:hypothetical protein
MRKNKLFSVFAIVLFVCLSLAQAKETQVDQKQLFSPAVGQRFYEIAYEIANSAESTEQKNEQGLVFLQAASRLDKRAKYCLPEAIKLASRCSRKDNSQMMLQFINNYLDENSDLNVISQAIQYVLERLNSREQREKLLTAILQNNKDRNPVLESELATLLALLKAETADIETVKYYLVTAYNKNKCNKLAFAKLVELMPAQINPFIYIERLRFLLRENPLDMNTALAFAQYAAQIQLYQTAADAYKYCADLFRYLYPSDDLPADIYLPWAICCYNTERDQHKALQLAEDIRKTGRFDLVLEAIAGKAVMKTGDTVQANRILKVAEEKARQLYAASQKQKSDGQVIAEQLAWFYCFALQDSNNALEWANKAYAAKPNSPQAAALLAYTLVQNNQLEWAKPIIDSNALTPVSSLALAQIQLANGQKETALKTLKSIITNDSGSLVAERAKEVLKSNGGEYVPAVESEVVVTALRNGFNQKVVPEFASAEKIISVGLNVKGSAFSYGNDFGGSVSITNNSSEPLIISEDSLFTGNIQVDANISGDINEKIPALISMRIRPSLPIEPGHSLVVPLRLVTGKLQNMLLTYPQASLNIEFTVYIDPVTTAADKIGNKLADIKPVKATITRPGADITSDFLRNRVNSFSKQTQAREKTSQLFIGLLLEQQAMAGSEPLYKFKYADWMPAMLKSAVVKGLTDSDWISKVHVMSYMLTLSLDYELLNAVSENLNDEYWPTRMMTLYLLAQAKDADFSKVLDWVARYDSEELVRELAVALGGTAPTPPPQPAQPVVDANQPKTRSGQAQPTNTQPAKDQSVNTQSAPAQPATQFKPSAAQPLQPVKIPLINPLPADSNSKSQRISDSNSAAK